MTENTFENWYAALVKPNGFALAEKNLAQQGFAYFAPKRMERVTLRGKLTDVSRLLFSGYIFVRFNPVVDTWQAINATRGIARLIINDVRHPHHLPAPFMAGLMARCDEDGMLQGDTALSPGDKIRVISGPFADIVTSIETLDEKGRLQVLIDLMGQKVRTKLPPASVNRL